MANSQTAEATRGFAKYPEQTESGQVFIMNVLNTEDPARKSLQLAQLRKDLKSASNGSIGYALSLGVGIDEVNQGRKVTAWVNNVNVQAFADKGIDITDGMMLNAIPGYEGVNIGVREILGSEVLE